SSRYRISSTDTHGAYSRVSSVSSSRLDPVDSGSGASSAMTPSFAGSARDGGLTPRFPAVDRADHEVEDCDEEGEYDDGDPQAHGSDVTREELVQRRPQVGEQRNGEHEVDGETYRESTGAGFDAWAHTPARVTGISGPLPRRAVGCKIRTQEDEVRAHRDLTGMRPPSDARSLAMRCVYVGVIRNALEASSAPPGRSRPARRATAPRRRPARRGRQQRRARGEKGRRGCTPSRST